MQQQLQRERELREKQLQEQQQQDYKKEQLLSKDKTIVQQQMSLQSKFVFKEEEPLKTAGGADVKSRIHQMQRLIADQQSDTKPKEPISVIQKPAIKCVKYQARYDFDPRNTDELAIKEGDIIVVNPDHKNAQPGWLFGECNGKSGLFPKNYADKLSDQLPAAKETGKVESNPQSAVTVGVNVAQLRQTLKLDLMGGRMARKPVVSEIYDGDNDEDHSDVDDFGSDDDDDDDNGNLEQVIAMYPYSGQQSDELTFFKGSIINVMSKEGGWWKGVLNGKVGVFPSNYVQPLTSIPVTQISVMN